MSTIAGYLFVCALVLLGAGAAALVHLVARPKGQGRLRASDALRELEPRGGRQRFSVRVFEVAALGTLWVCVTGAVLLLLAATPEPTNRVGGVLGVGVLAVAVATWWAWRRGALRSARAPRLEAAEGGEMP
jgi:hypothetical protein